MVQGKGFIEVYSNPGGPRVCIGGVRVHHWQVGLIALISGAFGASLDRDKDRQALYRLISLIGLIVFLDDLPDFISSI
jgi:hypothetical protein